MTKEEFIKAQQLMDSIIHYIDEYVRHIDKLDVPNYQKYADTINSIGNEIVTRHYSFRANAKERFKELKEL